MSFYEEPKGRWLMFCQETDMLYEENNPTTYQQAINAGVEDVTGDPVWEGQFAESAK